MVKSILEIFIKVLHKVSANIFILMEPFIKENEKMIIMMVKGMNIGRMVANILDNINKVKKREMVY